MTAHGARIARKANSTIVLEIIIVIAVVTLAFAIRLIGIEQLPPGMHGDEATAGLLGLRMLKEWNFTPYTSLAAGMTAWPLVLYGLTTEVFGRTLFAIRIVSVVEGTLTVLAFYWLTRKYFGWESALVAALLLTTSEWHIHFSRVGFPLIGWPLLVILESWAVLRAMELKRRRDWILAGLLTGFGIYIYNPHLLVVGILSLFIALYLVREKINRTSLVAVGTFYIAAILMSIPMIIYAVDPSHDYLAHFSDASLTKKPEWQQSNMDQKIHLILERYQDWWIHTTIRQNDRDPIDGLGVTPIIGIPLLPFAGLGIIFGMQRRSRLAVIGLLFIVLMPLSAALTAGGYARRTFPLLPFLLLFAGAGFVALLKNFERWKKIQPFVIMLTLGIITMIVIQNLNDYFNTFETVANEEFLFVRDHTAATLWMAKLPSGCFVEFSSGVRSLHYEVTLFFAPDVRGEDNSIEFGTGFTTLADSSKGTPVWVLLDAYRTKIDQVRQANPGGLTEVNGDPQNPLFVAYRLLPCVETVPTFKPR